MNRERPAILGNHRDAWNHGAIDPNSGTAAWLEAARGLAAAVESGWQPRRTIISWRSWDAEEYGLLGSVEWGEDHAGGSHRTIGGLCESGLRRDGARSGNQWIALSPSPASGVRRWPILTREAQWASSGSVAWPRHGPKKSPVDLSQAEEGFELHLGALGSGSDYTVFLDHLGVASLDFGFQVLNGVYHSVYDSFRWMGEVPGDPGFSSTMQRQRGSSASSPCGWPGPTFCLCDSARTRGPCRFI